MPQNAEEFDSYPGSIFVVGGEATDTRFIPILLGTGIPILYGVIRAMIAIPSIDLFHTLDPDWMKFRVFDQMLIGPRCMRESDWLSAFDYNVKVIESGRMRLDPASDQFENDIVDVDLISMVNETAKRLKIPVQKVFALITNHAASLSRGNLPDKLKPLFPNKQALQDVLHRIRYESQRLISVGLTTRDQTDSLNLNLETDSCVLSAKRHTHQLSESNDAYFHCMTHVGNVYRQRKLNYSCSAAVDSDVYQAEVFKFDVGCDLEPARKRARR